MATDSRTLKLAILGEVKGLSDSLNKGSGDVQSFGDKITKFGKVAAGAFAVATAAAVVYAGKLAIDGVKAAIEDEAAQKRLAKTIENTTGATKDQIAKVEDYITKTSLATGVNDELLRPSLDRLLRATEDITEAQDLQTLALDIAAGTGKDLTTVSDALAKAHDGNFTALRKLGGKIDDSIIKSKDFEGATASLAKTFEGQATAKAETFAGKLDRLRIAFDEGKETIGAFILDAITPIVTLIVNKVVPAVQDFIDSIGGKKGLTTVFNDFIDFAKLFFTPIIEGIKDAFDKVKDAIGDNKESFKTLFNFLKDFVAPFLGNVLGKAIDVLGTALGILIDVIGKVITVFDKVFTAIKRAFDLLRDFVNFIKNNPITGAIGGLFGGGRAAGGPVSAGTTYLVGENGPELFTSSTSGRIIPNGAMGGTQLISQSMAQLIQYQPLARLTIYLTEKQQLTDHSTAWVHRYWWVHDRLESSANSNYQWSSPHFSNFVECFYWFWSHFYLATTTG